MITTIISATVYFLLIAIAAICAAVWIELTGGSGTGASVTNFSTYQNLLDDTTVSEGNFGTVTGMNNSVFLKLSNWFSIVKSFVFATTSYTRGFYQMENNGNDSSGNGYDGTETDMSYVSGKVGNAGSFNGTSSYINMPDNVVIGGSTTQTISMWFKLANSTQAGKVLIELLENTTKASIIIGYNSGTLQFRRIKQNIAINEVTYSLTNTSDWHHAVLVYNASEGKLYAYLDGIAVGTVSSSGSGSGTVIIKSNIGNSETSSATFFSGYIDEVIIETRVWTPDMVLDYYKTTK